MFWQRNRTAEHPHATSMEAHDDMAVSEVSEPYDPMHATMAALEALVGVGLLIVEVIVGLRFFFLLAGANAANNFVDLIYDISLPLVRPFDGIIADRTAANGIMEPDSIIAFIVYAAAAWIVVALIGVAERGIVPRSYSSRGIHHFGRRGHAH
jgi:hypothetical protein